MEQAADAESSERPEEEVNSSERDSATESSQPRPDSSRPIIISQSSIGHVDCTTKYEDHRSYVHIENNIYINSRPTGVLEPSNGQSGPAVTSSALHKVVPCAQPEQASIAPQPTRNEEVHRYVAPHPPVEPHQNAKWLTRSIECYPDKPISKKAHVYPGKQHMGSIAAARDVAIKVTDCTGDKKREAQNLVKLTPHVNVVAVYAADTFPSIVERLFIVMEKCNPLTLEDYIKKRKELNIPFNPSEAVEFSKQLIEGMNHIHLNNIIHRDLKPSSVLFSACGRFLKIIDFGVSKAIKFGCSMISLSTLKIGTDGFRAPETYNKDVIGKASDIFSLGILLYHVWSYGYHPFGGIDLWSYNIKNKVPPVFSGLLLPDADLAIELLEGMLVNDPTKRFSINQVRTHPFNIQVVNDTLTKTSDALWTGSIERPNDLKNLNDCVLYKEKAVEGARIDSRWKLELDIVPTISQTMLRVPVEKTPDGYLGMKQASYKELRNELKEEGSMAWINIFNHQGKRTRVLLIIHPQDHDELYGVLVNNPERLVTACENNLQHKQEDSIEEPAGSSDGDQLVEKPHEGEEVDSVSAMAKTSRQTSATEELEQESLVPATSPEVLQEVTRHEAQPRLSVPIGQLALMSWWMHDPLANEQATVPKKHV